MLLDASYDKWSADGAPRMAAALAYYTTLSLAPLLLVIIAVAGFFLGPDAVRGELVGQIRGMTGVEGARTIEDVLANASRPASSALASLVGIAMLLVGASGVVIELENALNTIWKVGTSAQSWRTFIGKRIASLGLLLGVGFLLLVSLAVSALLAAANRWVSSFLPGSETAWMMLETTVSFAVVTALFALLFKFLPDTPIRWADVWFGAACTAGLFALGKLLIGLYLGRSSLGSTYGAAGSLVVILVWIYYTSQIVLFGAELTYVHARSRRDRRLAEARHTRPARVRS